DAITCRISSVAACCSRASFSSLPGAGTDECFDRMAAGAMRRLVLPDLRPFGEPAVRPFAALVLPPVLDGRAISAPRSRRPSYPANLLFWNGQDRTLANWPPEVRLGLRPLNNPSRPLMSPSACRCDERPFH